MKKERIDVHMVTKGLAPSRTKAQELIRAGLVSVKTPQGEKQIRNPSQDDFEGEILIRPHGLTRYVSRGGIKMEGALDRINLDVHGFKILDVGISTGGFTDCLLQRGALSSVGVEVGHGQLAPRLKTDPRVKCMEGLNARNLSMEPKFLDAIPAGGYDLTVLDVSFISVFQIWPQVLSYTRRVLSLVKPQFEVGPENLKEGIVKDDSLYLKVEKTAREAVLNQKWDLVSYFPSSIEGKDGNREFFAYFQRPGISNKGIKNLFSLCIVVMTLFFHVACQSVQRRNSGIPPAINSETPPDSKQQTTPGTQEPIAESPAIIQPPVKTTTGPVGIILGPGGLRSYAHAGFLQELLKAKVPIQGIVGLELGALIGALGAQRKQGFDLEWQVLKLKEDHFREKSLITRQDQPQSLEHLRKFLDTNFQTTKLEDFSIPFGCPSFNIQQRKSYFLSRGSAVTTLSACLPFPPMFKSLDGNWADIFSLDSAIQFLKARGAQRIVYISLLGQQESEFGLKDEIHRILWTQVAQALERQSDPSLEIVRIPLQDIGILDFSQREEFLRRGRTQGKVRAEAWLRQQF